MSTTNNKYLTSAAGLLAGLTAAGLTIRIVLAAKQFESLLGGLSHLYQFFTITTNTLVFMVMLRLALGRSVHRTILLATVASIVAVGIIFHTLLGSPEGQQGWDFLANLITHTLVPLFTLLWWLGYAELSSMRWSDTWFCLPWPAAYCVYALSRAEVSGFYPYPFINLHKLGWLGLGKSAIGLGLAFLMLGLILVTYAKLHKRVLQKSAPVA